MPSDLAAVGGDAALDGSGNFRSELGSNVLQFLGGLAGDGISEALRRGLLQLKVGEDFVIVAVGGHRALLGDGGVDCDVHVVDQGGDGRDEGQAIGDGQGVESANIGGACVDDGDEVVTGIDDCGGITTGVCREDGIDKVNLVVDALDNINIVLESTLAEGLGDGLSKGGADGEAKGHKGGSELHSGGWMWG